jgi:phosphoribosyl 1,2-cyclic phosphate phosphodiesterase
LTNNPNKIKVTVLGTGTSIGVPVIGCNCAVCKSNDPRDKRLRSSILIESECTKVLVDTGPDLRTQFLQNDISSIDAVFYTHAHYDHIAGLDDLRPVYFQSGKAIPIFGSKKTLNQLAASFSHIFGIPEQIGGGIIQIDSFEFFDNIPVTVGNLDIIPVPVKHGNLDIHGFRIGNFAYLTDASQIPESSMKILEGVEVMIVNALRYNKHTTHFNFEEAVEIGKRIGAKKTFFTHLAHAQTHQNLVNELPEGFSPAYDGMIIEL